VFVLDASAVTPLALLLLAGAVVTVETVVPDPDAKGPKGEPEVIVVLDSWLRYRLKERQANLVLAFRARVGEMLCSWLAADSRSSGSSGGDAKLLSALAVILQATGAGDDDTERADVGVKRTNQRNLEAASARIRRPPLNASIGAESTPKTPPTEEEVARSAAQKLALEELAVARRAAEETAKIEAAQAAKVRSAADAIEVKAATLRLMRQSEDRALAERSKKHMTVATLLKSLELEHCAQKFADAGVDDNALNDVIDALKEDGEVGAEEMAALIKRVGMQGGEGFKIKRALSKPKGASGGRGENGSRGGRGRGNVKGKEVAVDKKTAAKTKPPPKMKK
jgi:hypothetical protein